MSTSRRSSVLSRLRSAPRTLFVADGRVACPRAQHDVDVDWCLTCPSLVGLLDATGTGAVHCRVAPAGPRTRRL